MDFNWTPDQITLRAKYAEFGQSVIAPEVPELYAAHQFNQDGWEQLAASGFWGHIIPTAYGGTGINWWNFLAAAEGLSTQICDSGFILSVISHAGFIYGLHQHGSPAQKAMYFPRLFRGALTATCIAESHTGSHTPSVRTSVTGAEGAWRMNGEKWNIAHAPTAEIFLVVGRIPALGKRDITLFLLDERHPGIARGKAQEKMGNCTIPTSWLKFEEVAVLPENILGMPGDGLRTLMAPLALDRVLYGLLATFLVEPAVHAARTFLQDRVSGKAALLDQQHVQRKFADAAQRLAASRWLGRAAYAQVLGGDAAARHNSSAAKLAGTQAFAETARDMVTLLGSRGYQDSVASRLLRDALGFASVGGTEELHRMNLFQNMFRTDSSH